MMTPEVSPGAPGIHSVPLNTRACPVDGAMLLTGTPLILAIVLETMGPMISPRRSGMTGGLIVPFWVMMVRWRLMAVCSAWACARSSRRVMVRLGRRWWAGDTVGGLTIMTVP